MAESHDQESIYNELEKRTRRAGLWMLVGLAGIVLILSWRAPGAFVFGALLVLAGAIVSNLAYRCPACEESIGKGFPTYCPSCGVRLTRPRK